MAQLLVAAVAVAVAAAFLAPKIKKGDKVDEEELAFGMPEEHLNIVYSASDPIKVEEFYGEILGLEHERPFFQVKLGKYGYYNSYRVGRSEVKFIIASNKDDLPKMKGGTDNACGLRLATIPMLASNKAGFLKRLAEKGFDPPSFSHGPNKSEYCTIRDYDDNEIELVFHGNDSTVKEKSKLQLRLTVKDKAAVKEFLTKTIGLMDKGQITSIDGRSMDCYAFGGSELHVWETKKELPNWTGGPFEQLGPCLVQLFVGDVPKAKAIMLERRGKIHTEPFFLGRVPHVMFVEGPGGLLVEFAGVKYYNLFLKYLMKRK